MKTKIDWREIRGDTRKRTYFLARLEVAWIKKIAPRVPFFIETYHLTLSSIFFSLGIVLFSCLAGQNKIWLLAVSFFILFHYLTDALDGEVGRLRNTGLISWGFYADHFLDMLTVIAIFLGYFFIYPEYGLLFYLNATLLLLHFGNGLLVCIASGNYSTSGTFGIGPTELTLALLIFNLYAALGGQANIALIFSLSALGFFVSLFYSFITTQKKLWQTDWKKKNEKKENLSS
ncbi:MAG: CDP-alcohol phosphatidyltransferase family protein [Candidatus Shapirobacteria bacterium]